MQKWYTGQYSLRQTAKMYKYSKSTMYQIIKKFGEHHTLEDLPKSRHGSGPENPQVDENVMRLLKSLNYLSVREIAKKVGVSVGTVQNIKKYIYTNLRKA